MALRAREEGFTAALGREKMPEVRLFVVAFHG